MQQMVSFCIFKHESVNCAHVCYKNLSSNLKFIIIFVICMHRLIDIDHVALRNYKKKNAIIKIMNILEIMLNHKKVQNITAQKNKCGT